MRCHSRRRKPPSWLKRSRNPRCVPPPLRKTSWRNSRPKLTTTSQPAFSMARGANQAKLHKRTVRPKGTTETRWTITPRGGSTPYSLQNRWTSCPRSRKPSAVWNKSLSVPPLRSRRLCTRAIFIGLSGYHDDIIRKQQRRVKQVRKDLPVMAPLYRIFFRIYHCDQAKQPHPRPTKPLKQPGRKFDASFSQLDDFETIVK